MKILITTFFLFALLHHSFAQKLDLVQVADSITNEGKTLYQSEWTSWYGTDVFTEKCKSLRPLSGGYLSYDTGKGLNNVFFSKGANPVVLATISFDYGFNPNNYKLDSVKRNLNQAEMELYTIRQAVVDDISKDTLFKRYNNTSLNPVPIISNNSKKVYVLTGPSISGIVVFGNDYLVTFDKNNNIISKKTLHKNIIAIPYVNKDGSRSVGSVHSHLPETGEFITATDICTLMLYEKHTTWVTHTVVSKDYVSFWDCKKDHLLILTMAAYKKIMADQQEGHGKSN